MMGGAAAGAAATAQAIRASGVLVRLDAEEFVKILRRGTDGLVVTALGGWLSDGKYQYLTSYKGLAFYTASGTPLRLPDDCEIVTARRILIPG